MHEASNILDIIATASFFLDQIIDAILLKLGRGKELEAVKGVMEIFAIVRILRLMKLTRHSSGLKILLQTFKASLNELVLLLLFMLSMIVIFASLMYYAERLQVRLEEDCVIFLLVLQKRARSNEAEAGDIALTINIQDSPFSTVQSGQRLR